MQYEDLHAELQTVNSPWKENVGIYSASCVLLRPDKLKGFWQRKVPPS